MRPGTLAASLAALAVACGSAGSSTDADGGGASSGSAASSGSTSDSGAPEGGSASGVEAGGVEAGSGPDSGSATASGSSSGAEAGAAGSGRCGAQDPKLVPEPVIPPVCAQVAASQAVLWGALPDESNLDTSRIQGALNACGAGRAVKLTVSNGNTALITGPLTIPSGVTLWVDAGVTLFGTRDPSVYGSASALITVKGDSSGIVGDGIIDGQGGEPRIGQTGSFWDANGSGGSSPALIEVSGATAFTLYRITLHDAPRFHVKLDANGFVVWGVTIKTPSKSTNSQGTTLTPASAHNTDGIDPGEAASNGYIVCSTISDGDDQIAIKGATGVDHLTIAHNHFGAGHGMSIGSETTGGVSNVQVYDLSIDGTGSGLTGGSSNGIRIKSDASRGGLVTNISYSDVCVRGLANPISISPFYSTATGTLIPSYTGITIQNFRSMATSVTPNVTIEGYDASHLTGLTLDNVIVDGIAASNVTSSYASITLGPGSVSFTPAGTGTTVTNVVQGTSTPNDCAGKWVTF